MTNELIVLTVVMLPIAFFFYKAIKTMKVSKKAYDPDMHEAKTIGGKKGKAKFGSKRFYNEMKQELEHNEKVKNTPIETRKRKSIYKEGFSRITQSPIYSDFQGNTWYSVMNNMDDDK